MKTIVILPGGYHPYHAGHAALYQSAVKAFPGADVYVAATNDTKTRPFPFAIKEKLAKLAGVAPGHFIQVKSPFKAEEITSQYNPDEDVLIFVRSEKDRTESPKPGGMKKDGTPAYFQPYTKGQLQSFNKHAYMAYLPTVEFGPGITSATEIRNAWPTLNDKRKTAMVMSLYPVTQKNPALAANVVKMLDMGMGETEQVNEFGVFPPSKKQLGITGMREPLKTHAELASMLKITYNELNALARTNPGFPKPVEGIRGPAGTKGYYKPSEFKRWVIDNGIISKLKSIQGVAESRNMCNVCGQTPCNCTYVNESEGSLEEAQLAGHLDVTGVLVGNHYDHGMLGPVKVTKVNGAESTVTAKSDGRAYKVATSTLRKRISTHPAAHNAYRFSESEFKELDPRGETVRTTPKVPFDNKYTTSTTMTDRKLARRGEGWKDMDTHIADVAKRKQSQGVAEGSEANDDLVSLLNSYEFYSDNGSVYVNGNGDKIARIGSNWKHQSGQRGTGAEELGNFLDSIQPAVESNVSESADYLPEK